MNAPERNVVRLALCLLVLGVVVRYLPWGLPSIESFEVGEALVVENTAPLPGERDSLVNNVNIVSKIDSNNVARPKKERKNVKKVNLPVHINSASVEELCALNGVGPKLAEKIVGVRESHGPFKTPSDLQKVPGIGKKKLEKLLSGVNFD